MSVAEEAMKFLYACLEDLEVERLVAGNADNCMPRSSTDTSCLVKDSITPNLPNSLEELTFQQRKDFLRHLICTAVSLRTVTQTFKEFDSQELDLFTRTGIDGALAKDKTTKTLLSVEDILSLPVGAMLLDDPIIRPDGRKVWMNSVSSGVQTELQEGPYESESRTLQELCGT